MTENNGHHPAEVTGLEAEVVHPEDVELLESEGPGDDDEDDDFDDDDIDDNYEVELSESGVDPPWSPVPLAPAYQFQEQFPEAAVEVVFPTVYEENRSQKLADLTTAWETKTITHRRMAEQAAKELGFEQYDYDEEQEALKLEISSGEVPPPLGGGDALAGRVGQGFPHQPPAPGSGVAKPAAPAGSGQSDSVGVGKRDDLSDQSVAAFKRDMRTSEVARTLLQLATEARRRTNLKEQDVPPDQKITKTEVLYMEDGGPKRCDRCIMWISDTSQCTIHPAEQAVSADQVCLLYVNGAPTNTQEGARPEGYVTADVSGLGEGNTSCGNCRYGNGRPECGHPAITPFPIDNRGGCCNAWRSLDGQPRLTIISLQREGLAQVNRRMSRLEEGVTKLAERMSRPPRITVNPPAVTVKPAKVTVNVPPAKAPVVNVEVQTPKPGPTRFERDDSGAIVRSIPEEPRGDA
jgi:hypothetical protein